MELSGHILKAANAVVSFVVVTFLCLSGAYAGYALWDNGQVYAAAENVQSEMLNLRPQVSDDDEDNTASFAELQAINADVCAWVTLENTRVDHPVLQGETNLTYINTDIYGDFALAGSIFLDSRNDRSFTDAYSIIYGHHMDGGRMFGDLELYKDKKFFNKNRTGQLILPDGAYDLEIYACVIVSASDRMIFDVELTEAEIDSFLSYVKKNALYYREDSAELLSQTQGARMLGFSTCSSEFTDARTVLLAVILQH